MFSLSIECSYTTSERKSVFINKSLKRVVDNKARWKERRESIPNETRETVWNETNDIDYDEDFERPSIFDVLSLYRDA